MSYGTFKNFIDQVGDYLLLIVLWNWGEPFLNPDIFKMISYAKSKNILIHSSTNGNVPFSEEKAERLVKSGLDSLIIAVDGATQETYSKYRKGGNLELVLENIRTIVKIKKNLKSTTPRLTVRTVITKHNENELPQMRQLAEELKVDFFTIKTVAMSSDPTGTSDKNYIPKQQKYCMYEYQHQDFKRKKRPFVCMRPWKRITMDAQGELISCEYDYKSLNSFGTLNGATITGQVWKSDQSKNFRKNFNKGHNDYYHCKACVYKGRVADDCTVERLL